MPVRLLARTSSHAGSRLVVLTPGIAPGSRIRRRGCCTGRLEHGERRRRRAVAPERSPAPGQADPHLPDSAPPGQEQLPASYGALDDMAKVNEEVKRIEGELKQTCRPGRVPRRGPAGLGGGQRPASRESRRDRRATCSLVYPAGGYAGIYKIAAAKHAQGAVHPAQVGTLLSVARDRPLAAAAEERRHLRPARTWTWTTSWWTSTTRCSGGSAPSTG